MSEEKILKGLNASLSQVSLGPTEQGPQGLPERRCDPEPSPSLLSGAPGALSLAGPDPLRLRVHLDTVETQGNPGAPSQWGLEVHCRFSSHTVLRADYGCPVSSPTHVMMAQHTAWTSAPVSSSVHGSHLRLDASSKAQ